MKLRPYQTAAIGALRVALAEGHTKLLLCSPTGSGKTVMLGEIARSAISRGKKVLILASRRDLIRQPFCRLAEMGISVDDMSVVMSGTPDEVGQVLIVGARAEDCTSDEQLWRCFARRRPGAPITIASRDTLLSWGTYPDADIIIVDEAHETVGAGFQQILQQEKYKKAIVIGPTATPTRRGKLKLASYFTFMHVVSTYEKLAAEGYLVIPRMFGAWRLPDLSAIRAKGGDYDPDELEGYFMQDGLVGDIVEHWEKQARDKTTFVFACTRRHSKAIAKAFCDKGYDAVHVDSSMPVAKRDAIIEGAKKGSPQIVCNVDICAQGTDVKNVKCVIMARPTMSLRLFLQQVGRGSRPWKGEEFILLDHAGNILRHGFPHADQKWELNPKPKPRKRRGVEPLAPVWRCEECFRFNEIREPRCMNCGEPRPKKVRGEIAQHVGTLVEITEDLYEDCWELVVAEWRRRNAKRKVPIAVGWCYGEFRKRFKMPVPKGFPRPDMTDAERRKHAKLKECKAWAKETGRPVGAAYARAEREIEEWDI